MRYTRSLRYIQKKTVMARKVEFDIDKALHKAMKLFWLKGYVSTSMQDLVDTLGVNRFSLYNTFGDKRALFIKSLQHYRETVLAFLIKPLSEDKPAKQRVDDYLLLMADLLQSESAVLGCMIQNTGLSLISQDSEVSRMLVAMFDDLRCALKATILEVIQEEGVSQKYNPDVLADFILSQIQGLIILRKTLGSLTEIDKQVGLLRTTVASW